MSFRSVILSLAASIVSLAACGGGGGGGATGGAVSGTAVKGPVRGGTVTAYAISSGARGTPLGSGTTDASGDFTIEMGAYTGPVMLQMTGGTYADEATGASMPMMSGDELATCLPAVAAGSTITGIELTPLTTMACARARSMAGGMTDTNIDTANTAVGSYFSVSDIVHVMPMDPTVPGSGSGATQDQKDYGMSIAAMSQYADTVGMTSSSGMVTAMTDDASDGVMDGAMGGAGISMSGMGGMMGGMMQSSAGTAGLSTAMGTFIASPMNRSGVTVADMQGLMSRLAASNGSLQ